MGPVHQFPKGFLWGVSTSSYQVEGGVHEDGRGESIWDTFSHTPGKIHNNENGDVAADSYHRWQEDLQIITDLGAAAYRFSIAWPRVLPQGTGKVNEPGLAFYDRLVDKLLEKGITPVVTLYHWDLPAALQGAWLNRATAQAFVEYADVVTRRLGDRVKWWTTLNEPWCAAFLSYLIGIHAPGEHNLAHALKAAHLLQLAHGMAVPVIRANVPGAQVSLAVNPSSCTAATDSAADREALRYHDGLSNRWLLDPIYGKGYPADMQADFKRMGVWQEAPEFVEPGDMEIIAAPIDILGVNYYSRQVISADPEHPGQPEFGRAKIPAGAPVTDFGWEIHPRGLYDLLQMLNQRYAPGRMFIAENGASYGDSPDASGRVHDERRTAYLRSHLSIVAQAIADGLPVEGYFVWSLLDNFEWSAGYSQRFGLVYVDYATQKRYPKDSAFFYRQVMASNRVEE